MSEIIRFKLNGRSEELKTQGDRTLLWVLRTDFTLTGTKYGCGEGYCGACTVLVDDEPIRSCQYEVKDIDGKKVITIEGVEQDKRLAPLQQAFIEHDALQCGYCTPGMIMNAGGLLLRNQTPSRAEIIEAMDENLCRCGSYGRIIEAIQTAAREMKGTVRK
jgi:carbon-monoxide dehydrogenase small subunit